MPRVKANRCLLNDLLAALLGAPQADSLVCEFSCSCCRSSVAAAADAICSFLADGPEAIAGFFSKNGSTAVQVGLASKNEAVVCASIRVLGALLLAMVRSAAKTQSVSVHDLRAQPAASQQQQTEALPDMTTRITQQHHDCSRVAPAPSTEVLQQQQQEQRQQQTPEVTQRYQHLDNDTWLGTDMQQRSQQHATLQAEQSTSNDADSMFFSASSSGDVFQSNDCLFCEEQLQQLLSLAGSAGQTVAVRTAALQELQQLLLLLADVKDRPQATDADSLLMDSHVMQQQQLQEGLGPGICPADTAGDHGAGSTSLADIERAASKGYLTVALSALQHEHPDVRRWVCCVYSSYCVLCSGVAKFG